jgi:hypothetical protein
MKYITSVKYQHGFKVILFGAMVSPLFIKIRNVGAYVLNDFESF